VGQFQFPQGWRMLAILLMFVGFLAGIGKFSRVVRFTKQQVIPLLDLVSFDSPVEVNFAAHAAKASRFDVMPRFGVVQINRYEKRMETFSVMSGRRQDHFFLDLIRFPFWKQANFGDYLPQGERERGIVHGFEVHLNRESVKRVKRNISVFRSNDFYIYPLAHGGGLEISLPLNGEKSVKSQDAAYYAQSSQNPIGEVCRSESSFQILLGLRLVISVFMCCGSITFVYSGPSRWWCLWLGCIGMALGMLLLLAPIPWNGVLCGKQDSEYRQQFQHDAVNVSEGRVAYD